MLGVAWLPVVLLAIWAMVGLMAGAYGPGDKLTSGQGVKVWVVMEWLDSSVEYFGFDVVRNSPAVRRHAALCAHRPEKRVAKCAAR